MINNAKKFLAFPLKFVFYTPKIIDGVPETPPLITSVKLYLQVHTIIGMSKSSLNIYKILRKYPLAYEIR